MKFLYLQEYYASLLFAHVNLTEAEACDRTVQLLQKALDAFFWGSRLVSPHKSRSSNVQGLTLCTTPRPSPDFPSEAKVIRTAAALLHETRTVPCSGKRHCTQSLTVGPVCITH